MTNRTLEYCCKFCGQTLKEVSYEEYRSNNIFIEALVSTIKSQHYRICPAVKSMPEDSVLSKEAHNDTLDE